MSSYVFGIDLGASNLRVLLCDETARPVHEAIVPTLDGNAEAVLDQIAEQCRVAIAGGAVEPAAVVAAGVGAPGAIDRDGALRLAPNLPPFGDLALADALRSRLGVPVTVDNDVNMATVGEHRRGAGRGSDDVAFLAIGTGIGMGFIAGGRLQHGATGAAGEVAGLPFGVDPFDLDNQRRGALEEAASGSGIAARYAARTGTARTAEEIFARAAAGDAQADAVLRDQAVAVALAIVTVHAIIDPSVVVLGGGLGCRADLLESVRERIADLTPRPIAIASSALGRRAGLVGAAVAALRLAEEVVSGPPPVVANRDAINEHHDA